MFALFSISLQAQQKTGNLVEYFGKEKVNEISEGDLMYIFKEGLMLRVPTFGFNSSSFPKDPVFYRFLENPNLRAHKNEVVDIGALGDELKWQAISVDESNTFSNNRLRSSYVYLSYRSGSRKTVLFEASGHSLLLINGLPHEGDHYDFGWNLIPVTLKKGINTFVLKVGRFPRIRARLIEPNAKVQFTTRDLTLPHILKEDQNDKHGAIRIINSTSNWLKNYTLHSEIMGATSETSVAPIAPMSVQKIPFSIKNPATEEENGNTELKLSLKNSSGKLVSQQGLDLKIKSKHLHHTRTFISDVDGSVQYYCVAPSTDKETESQALFLSVHGASVKAENQANAYKKKDWGNLIAPTNRRPFGYAWEDWGRLDALEVLADAKNIYQPDLSKIYLTGHSMGGHGTWYLGATYPDYFAAIAPCAGYPDLLLYRNGFLKRRMDIPKERLAQFGITPKMLERMTMEHTPNLVEEMIHRAGTPSRTLKLIRNYLHHGVYIFHGEIDNVVPTFYARDMRERLSKFHADFSYYEYPDGKHWFGNHSVDWAPIFQFFKRHTIKKDSEIKKLEFFTGSPGVSSTSHFISIHQQKKAFDVSSFEFNKDKNISIKTDNVDLLTVDLKKLGDTIKNLTIDDTDLTISDKGTVYFKETNGAWEQTAAPSLKEKGPHRNGGFKDAFRNKVVLVYASKGNVTENTWYYNRARFDAETFWYRANGNIEIVKDVDFAAQNYPDRNVILYGNRNNNAAWKQLMQNSPVQVGDNLVQFGDKTLKGDQWGLYFIVPRSDSDIASIGVVSATGTKGRNAAYMNHYLVNGTTFPDVLIFDDSVLLDGEPAVKCAGFFGNDWGIESGDFEWK
jgi:predicted esterase